MPFQTDVVAVRAPYSVEGAVKKSHLFPVKHSVVDRFRNTSLVPSPCLLARRDLFFFAFVNLITLGVARVWQGHRCMMPVTAGLYIADPSPVPQ